MNSACYIIPGRICILWHYRTWLKNWWHANLYNPKISKIAWRVRRSTEAISDKITIVL